jgi:branched-chain amino acid transport system ATP-binding protein
MLRIFSRAPTSHTLRDLNAEGLTILLLGQNARQALRSTHRACLIDQDRVVREGHSDELADDPEIIAHCQGQSMQLARVTA